MEHRIVTPSRIVKYVLEHCETFYDSEGAPLRSVGVMQDITDRKQIENMLKESRSRLVEAQHIAHIGNWELDIAENKVIWSNEVYYIYETDPASFGATYADFINAVHPADREAIIQRIKIPL